MRSSDNQGLTRWTNRKLKTQDALLHLRITTHRTLQTRSRNPREVPPDAAIQDGRKRYCPCLHEDFTNSKTVRPQPHGAPSAERNFLFWNAHYSQARAHCGLTPLLLICPQPTQHQALCRAEHRVFRGWTGGGFSPIANPTLWCLIEIPELSCFLG